jgi:DNA-binding response OmpR family regulator
MTSKPLVVVVVDDEECITRLIRRSLDPDEYDVHSASEGRKGIETILELKPDLVILDVRIPIVQGYEVCRFIKRNPDTRQAKVLMISALMSASDRQWARDCGADETMQKPFDRMELMTKVMGLVSRNN